MAKLHNSCIQETTKQEKFTKNFTKKSGVSAENIGRKVCALPPS